MKLQFRHQKFQADAAKAVCDVFAGQLFHAPTYMIDPGLGQQSFEDTQKFTGFNNAPVTVSDDKILENIRAIQRTGQIKPSDKLEGRYNLTIEMETGVGKTYTYIKTMYELNKRYGWSKFIVVVPSVAIREGVYKSFQVTEEHFAEDYGKKIRYFVYNSAQLTEIDRFASDSALNVMIINSQAFNARGKDARRIYMKLDEFRSRRPIDILAKTNPIMIIDEPQSVEGKVTKERLKEFTPLMTLRYSATHRADSIYNMIYRLDALEAYNKRLVKKIAVKGISVSGSTATEGYVYIQSINLSKGNPTATLEFDIAGKSGVRKATRTVGEGYNLYDNSGELAEYKNGYTVLRIDGRDSSVEFTNGIKLFAGDVIGSVSEEQLRRIQIRETILSHIERERQLFSKGIKVLSLFFIDEVAKYKQYDAHGNAVGGVYAQVFEEEYRNIVGSMQLQLGDSPEYLKYLDNIPAENTHAGYFSIDRKSGRIIDSKLGDRKERTSDDADAYDLIMKDKERLLDFHEPVRFIFSHSALREGWDNPNVFQICTLKQSSSDVRKRQEVGRGLRLAVNQNGERMDENVLAPDEVQKINVLTVIANESYESFARGLQSEIAEAVADRPHKVEAKLFVEKFGEDIATVIHESLIENGYVKRGELTEKYYEAKKSGTLKVPEEAEGKAADIIAVLDSVYDPNANKPENARKNNVEITLDKEKLNSKAFQKLWSRINGRSYYIVSFDEAELVKKSIVELNKRLRIPKIYFKVEQGEQVKTIESKDQLLSGEGFVRADTVREEASPYTTMKASRSVRYDLVGKIVGETGLTRQAVVAILTGIDKMVFDQFGNNPEEFIIRAANLINEQKATAIIEHITYNKLTEAFSTDIFTEPDLNKGALGINAIETKRNLYDYVIYDSANERNFATELEAHSQEVEVYVKLPRGFYISTPVGKYNPDWAIAFYEGKVKHIYFVAETKGDMSSLELRDIEKAKAHCAREHFRAISGDKVVYDVVDSYDKLWELVQG
ncbi:type III restriction-modification system endonuclease [Caproiciproducens sp. CPB-2]|uniref:type III restriction-modification system endonuclease n=1 Tax=Caproiciproducens sp. CPB-2 TaxID=3030017 RepID=UPI0023DB85F9|nr:DEAD/DEAH box helicase family protein [Caproiciproducens sp. CPB-2]MDF1495817.1 DEAD/DEAH box helicase family protein [Caproiciproducens sp. CPB-2]